MIRLPALNPLVAATVSLAAVSHGGFLTHELDGSVGAPSGLCAADIDGDNAADVAGTAWDDGKVYVWLAGDGWSRQVVDDDMAGATFVDCGDIDGDGLEDLAATAWTREVIRCYYADGFGGWVAQEVSDGMAGAHEVHIFDVDGDGDKDLMTAVAGLDRISWWENGGGTTPSWMEHLVSDEVGGARSVFPADINGDGNVDLVAAAFSDNRLIWWEGDGGASPQWEENVISSDLPGAHMVRAGDLDGDGDMDLATAAYYCAEAAVWINMGGSSPAWEKHVLDDSFGHALAVCIAEIDGQGHPDVAATSEFRDRVKWWWNDGGPPSDWPSETVDDDLDGAWPISFADLDGDSRNDLVAGGNFTTLVRWYENQVETGLEPDPAASPGISVCPNPSYGSVRITLAADCVQEPTVRIYDMCGRTVARLSTRSEAEGLRTCSWNGIAADGTPAEAGVYMVAAAGFDAPAINLVLLP